MTSCDKFPARLFAYKFTRRRPVLQNTVPTQGVPASASSAVSEYPAPRGEDHDWKTSAAEAGGPQCGGQRGRDSQGSPGPAGGRRERVHRERRPRQSVLPSGVDRLPGKHSRNTVLARSG